jgi:hypothetical protein
MERPSTGAAVGRHPQPIATDTIAKTIAGSSNLCTFIAQ